MTAGPKVPKIGFLRIQDGRSATKAIVSWTQMRMARAFPAHKGVQVCGIKRAATEHFHGTIRFGVVKIEMGPWAPACWNGSAVDNSALSLGSQ